MLKDLFPTAYPRYLTLPILGPMLDDFADWLLAQGYHHATRRMHITRMAGVDASVPRHGRDTLEALAPEDLQACWQWYNQHQVHAASTVRVLQQYLAAHGRLPAPCPQPVPPFSGVSGAIHPLLTDGPGLRTPDHCAASVHHHPIS